MKLLPYILFEKYSYILALKMASPGNQHCVSCIGTLLFPIAEWLACWTGLRRRRAWVQIAVATLSGNSLRQTVHTHCASVHQAAKLVRYDTIRYFNVRSKADISQLNLPHGTDN